MHAGPASSSVTMNRRVSAACESAVFNFATAVPPNLAGNRDSQVISRKHRAFFRESCRSRRTEALKCCRQTHPSAPGGSKSVRRCAPARKTAGDHVFTSSLGNRASVGKFAPVLRHRCTMERKHDAPAGRQQESFGRYRSSRVRRSAWRPVVSSDESPWSLRRKSHERARAISSSLA
jgi:hypothetical protein